MSSSVVDGAVAVGAKKPVLLRSVLSSCSDRSLVELMREVRAISDVPLIDLYILRPLDILEIDYWLQQRGEQSLLPHPDPYNDDSRPSALLLAEGANFAWIADWISQQFDDANANVARQEDRSLISAMATYLPDISSRSQEQIRLDGAYVTPRRLAVLALANTVRLGIELRRRGLVAPLPTDPSSSPVIVELVCGTILDQCFCAECRNMRSAHPRTDYSMVASRESKIRLLCDSLAEVCEEVRKVCPGEKDWALSLELEPGPTYVICNTEQIDALLAEVDRRDGQTDPERRLAAHIGLNADIAHLDIAEVELETRVIDGRVVKGLKEFADRVVHAHICDHPGMHTRDQVLGTWKPVDRGRNELFSYVELLAQIAAAGPRESGLPFSRTIALELEGCNRINWIHQSLTALKHMLARV